MTQQHRARNTVGVILVHCADGGVAAFMVQEKNGNWGFVAGSTDPRETAFKALQREYGEEVGGVLPRLDAGRADAPGEPRKFIFHHSNGSNTALYAGYVPRALLPTPSHFRPNREIRAVRLVPLQQLHAMVLEHMRFATRFATRFTARFTAVYLVSTCCNICVRNFAVYVSSYYYMCPHTRC